MSDESDSERGDVPVSEAERRAFHEGMAASGTETSEGDIDEILYGEPPRPSITQSSYS
jgi:hypothetical protein